MNINFESWLYQQDILNEEKAAFKEAFTCYRAKAYRASMLFSWVGLMMILKHRILKSQTPENFREREGQWNNIRTNLADDDKWENETFRAIIAQADAQKVFNIPNSIREELKYWKIKRNDCAHFKNTEIAHFHVESFWSFIQSNLKKITILGGESDLLNRLKDHFDHTKTRQGQDITPLVQEIPTAVELGRLREFYCNLFVALQQENYITDNHLFQIIDNALANLSEDFDQVLIDLLKDEGIGDRGWDNGTYDDIDFLCTYPEHLNKFSYQPQEVREIWTTRLADGFRDNYAIYSAILRNNLIPLDQLDESYDLIIENSRFSAPEENDFTNLMRTNYKQKLEGKIIEWLGMNFKEINERSNIIWKYIEYQTPLNPEIVVAICKEQQEHYHSFYIEGKLYDLFYNKRNRFEEFSQVAVANGIQVPESLVPREQEEPIM